LLSLLKPPVGQSKFLSREDFAARYGASQADLDAVAEFARSHGLSVVESSVARRTVVVSGSVAQMMQAFAVELGNYESPTEKYRGREGCVHVPNDLADIVEGVFGLDNRRMAKRGRPKSSPPTADSGIPPPTNPLPLFTPPQVAKFYNFPESNAAGQTIGILEFSGGYVPDDIQQYFTGANSPLGRGFTTPTLVPVAIDGATNDPAGLNSEEVVLDICVAGAVAQGVKIAVYFAPETEQGWVDAVTTAVQDQTNSPAVLSISYGWPEFQAVPGSFQWSKAAIDAVSTTFMEAAVLGITVFVSSGDYGTSALIPDGQAHVLYPASDPWVTACGGTLITKASPFTEATWNYSSEPGKGTTGGGISDYFLPPLWQSSANLPASVNDPTHRGRGVPDVAGHVGPYTLLLRDASNNLVPHPDWGTSAVAPLYAGLVALMNANLGEHVGYLNGILYALGGTNVFRDINDPGVSNASPPAPGYPSGPGWDACQGNCIASHLILRGTLDLDN
jgi:kumamolisin